jgi:hypothetical protein
MSVLETSIFLIRQVIEHKPPFRVLSNALHALSVALLTRFIQAGWIEDVTEAVEHFMNMMDLWEDREQIQIFVRYLLISKF